MNFLSLLFIGVGLSLDCLAANITMGACNCHIKLRYIMKVAMLMAVFHAIMPLAGWFIGSGFRSVVEDYDHWIAFTLLIVIGVKFIYDGVNNDDKCEATDFNNNLMLLGIAVATSIDALVIGIGFGVIQINILTAIAIISSTTFVFAFTGLYFGMKIGTRINKGIEFIGGGVLIGLGTKILIEHLYFYS